MEHATIGRQLRARRTAAGRTVASVAADAGLSVPYVANLENGRGNPTTTALTRLAGALGMRLLVTLEPDEDSQQANGARSPEVPASLVRLGRTARYRQAVTAIATALNLDSGSSSPPSSWRRWRHSRTRQARTSPNRTGGASWTRSC